MRNIKGYAFVEIMVIIGLIIIPLSLIVELFVNNRGATEKRALLGAEKFLFANGIKAKRLSCAGDSNNDWFGTCNIVTADGEKIVLNCPTGYLDVNLFGASGCKEVLNNFNIMTE